MTLYQYRLIQIVPDDYVETARSLAIKLDNPASEGGFSLPLKDKTGSRWWGHSTVSTDAQLAAMASALATNPVATQIKYWRLKAIDECPDVREIANPTDYWSNVPVSLARNASSPFTFDDALTDLGLTRTEVEV